MIHRIYSSLDSFKELCFNPGFNIILSDKTEESIDLQTRNRAGKSSTIELIHFLLGADCTKSSIFKNPELNESQFGIELDLGEDLTRVERSGENCSKVVVVQANVEKWPIKPSLNKKINKKVISNENWNQILGHFTFSLPIKGDLNYYGKHGPTFRSLFSYFVRRQESGGIVTPFKNAYQQLEGNVQINISFLLGLDWTIAQKWQHVRDQEKNLKELKKATKEGTLGPFIGSSSDLRTLLTVEEDKLQRMQNDLNSFQVLPEYKTFEIEASQLSQQINDLTNQNTIDRQLIIQLEESLKDEEQSDFQDLNTVYEEAGVLLPDLILKRYEDVKAFHKRIIENRKLYLQNEIDEAVQRIQHRRDEMKEKSTRRAEIMNILKSHGALEHYSMLQGELTKVQAKIEGIKQQFDLVEKLENGKTDLDIERARLIQRLRQDYTEQASLLKNAIITFEDISRELYENAGSLFISESSNGPTFEVKIQGRKSKGISNMQIFCFDMMLMRLCHTHGIGPGFLVHDSHIFDGVDERQIAKAIEFAIKEVERSKFQYIITMNSDSLPKIHQEGINLADYVLPTRLTDATDEGGLFGVRF